MRLIARKGQFVCALLTVILSGSLFTRVVLADDEPKTVPAGDVRMSGPALHFGMKEYSISGAPLRVFSPAKTVADCFKFRSKVGVDVAIEALKECRQQKKASIDELAAGAKVCRFANVMRPYLESL